MDSADSTMEPDTSHTIPENVTATTTATASAPVQRAPDDPWWWEIENENLILDQAPNVTTVFGSDNATALSDDFNTLLRIGEHVNATLSVGNINTNSHNSHDTLTASTEIAPVAVAVAVAAKHVCVDSEMEVVASASQNAREQTLEEFKEELRIKRLARQSAVQDLRDEIATLRKQLSSEQALTRRLRTAPSVDEVEPTVEPVVASNEVDADDADPMSRGRHANIELANAQLSLQLANSENLSLRTELGVVQKQVSTLKEVIACCKQMLAVKDDQCTQLKAKLDEIETTFGERETQLMSDNLRQEYERQLGNIRQLRQLYEERQGIAAAEQANLQRLITIKKDELIAQQEKTKHFEERNENLVKEVENANNELATLREECNEHKFEKKALKEEMGAVNTLFSQMVMGFNGKNNLDIDRLTTMLEENRTLLNDMATKEAHCSDGATLPKLLFELVAQAAVESHSGVESETDEDDSGAVPAKEDIDDAKHNELGSSVDATDGGTAATSECLDATAMAADCPRKRQLRRSSGQRTKQLQLQATTVAAAAAAGSTFRFYEPEVIGKVASAQEIIGNLPKVWKVLMELLSHHRCERVPFEEQGASEDCYKSVDTPNGPKSELSVSKTYIKLKDLILEKKSLVKETSRLKTLNCHLEYRLNEQEKRLSAVSLELTKTWHLVGKMQRQHRQLHTQEQILRYQLQQKRRMLSELKDELEYCRRKWAAARAKNDESQEQCNDLRREFAKRKLQDANNSAESGYSDSGPPSDEEVVAPARRQCLAEMFEHTRRIQRMQSTSPGRAGAATAPLEIVLRWNSAPPSCDGAGEELPPRLLPAEAEAEGAVGGAADQRAERASRIQRLEEQCKSLIQQVLETSDNRERLEVQLCRFHEEIAPVQHAVPLDEFIKQRRLERMTRASSAPASAGSLTPREEEYTRQRSERLGRLEEESRQLLTRIKRTSDRGFYLRCSLDRIRRAPSREDSCESNTEEDAAKLELAAPDAAVEPVLAVEEVALDTDRSNDNPLTSAEQSYTTRRAERLQRLEEESRQLFSRLSRNTERGDALGDRLDALHQRCAGSEEPAAEQPAVEQDTVEQRLRHMEQISANRGQRLRLLEEQGQQLLCRLSDRSERGEQMMNRIAARELSRQAVASVRSEAEDLAAGTEEALREAGLAAHEVPIAAALLPTPKTVACSSIVGEELNERVVVTTTPSRIATQLGAVPKSKPAAQLSAGRPRVAQQRQQQQPPSTANAAGAETLEHMVNRLRDLPFPEHNGTHPERQEDAQLEAEGQESDMGK